MDLNRALECAEWCRQYSNAMSKETADIIVKLVAKIRALEEEAYKDAEYASFLRSEIDRNTSYYDCGEL